MKNFIQISVTLRKRGIVFKYRLCEEGRVNEKERDEREREREGGGGGGRHIKRDIG